MGASECARGAWSWRCALPGSRTRRHVFQGSELISWPVQAKTIDMHGELGAKGLGGSGYGGMSGARGLVRSLEPPLQPAHAVSRPQALRWHSHLQAPDHTPVEHAHVQHVAVRAPA